jgi:nicotinamide mononucleotide transporter
MSDLLAATVPLLAPAFSLGGTAVSWLELVALLLSVWMVLCNLCVNPLGWPLAMASSALYGLLFLHSKLYGEAGLQVLFILLAGWGWWQWLRGTGNRGQRLVVHWLGPRQRLVALLATLAAWPILGLVLHRLTDSDVPYLDALPTVGSMVGQILLARKQVENWAVWVAVNIVSVGLFATKGLWLTVGLYALFGVLAAVGWRRWADLAGEGRAHG